MKIFQTLLSWTLSVRRWAFGVFFNYPKKVPPPTPDGREGRLFPPEQSSKICQLLAELKRCRNKNLYKLYSPFRQLPRKPSDNVDLKGHSCSEREEFSNHLRKVAMRVLILHAQCASGKTTQSRRITSGRTSQHARSELSPSSPFYIRA